MKIKAYFVSMRNFLEKPFSHRVMVIAAYEKLK